MVHFIADTGIKDSLFLMTWFKRYDRVARESVISEWFSARCSNVERNLLERVRKTETAQRLLGFNRDRTETVDRDRGKTYAKNRDRGKGETRCLSKHLVLPFPRSLFFA